MIFLTNIFLSDFFLGAGFLAAVLLLLVDRRQVREVVVDDAVGRAAGALAAARGSRIAPRGEVIAADNLHGAGYKRYDLRHLG